MCGIVGIWREDGTAVSDFSLKKFRDSLIHRGPNGSGSFFDGSFALGHRRLSVLDTSNLGAQPMSSKDGRYHIAYNGEIFNFLELREELKKLGHRFVSDTDTEVILAAYQAWGKKCLERFNGMWAFAIWDKAERTLFLARDRYGIKPLYYTRTPHNIFAFASETIAFDSLDGFTKKINERYAAAALNNVFSLESKGLSLFEQVYQLRAGHYIYFDGKGEFAQTRWWYPNENKVSVPERYEDQVSQFRLLFEDACKLRLRSDVPVATALSGGIDSSAVYCMINKIMKEGSATRVPAEWQKAFVASFPGSSLDERAYAEHVVEHVGGKAEYISLGAGDIVHDIESSVKHFDAIHVSPLFVIGEIYKHMHDAGITVSLDGHGVDEMMYGYPDLVLEAYKRAKLFFDADRAEELISIYGNMYDKDYASAQMESIEKNTLYPKLLLRSFKKNKLAAHLWQRYRRSEWLNTPPSTFERIGEEDTVHTEPWLYENFYDTVLPTLLRNFDKVSMRHAIEIRMPFMDWRLVSFIFSLPERSKVGGGYTKRILRDSMKGIMPEDIRIRTRKIGINAPLHEWFAHQLKIYVKDIVHSQNFLQSNIWDGQKIADFVDARQKDKVWSWDDAIRVWPYLNAHLIMKN